ncbi:MAG TPA: NADH-quinone oxidoreductase subunit M, partial [Paracoccaceae bacterium]|nr:NADH-quinone oxidoreductase subunit M [Paracoccaceae bacterium]
GREKLLFAPLVFFTILLGIYPSLVLDMIGPSVSALLENYNAAVGTVVETATNATAAH